LCVPCGFAPSARRIAQWLHKCAQIVTQHTSRSVAGKWIIWRIQGHDAREKIASRQFDQIGIKLASRFKPFKIFKSINTLILLYYLNFSVVLAGVKRI
jgi:hypothetical protein